MLRISQHRIHVWKDYKSIQGKDKACHCKLKYTNDLRLEFEVILLLVNHVFVKDIAMRIVSQLNSIIQLFDGTLSP
jgi:hypothetical protein